MGPHNNFYYNFNIITLGNVRFLDLFGPNWESQILGPFHFFAIFYIHTNYETLRSILFTFYLFYIIFVAFIIYISQKSVTL